MSAPRIHRLLRLITLIHSGRAESVASITSELGVSRRTLFRDLKLLEDAGLPCTHEPGVGYRISVGLFLPPMQLTATEALAIMLLAKETSVRSDWPMRADALAAIDKLTATVPESIRSVCHGLLANVSIDPDAEPIDAKQTQHYTTLHRCIDERRSCSITYRDGPGSGVVSDILNPYALHFGDRSWYVIGKLAGKTGQCKLRLSQISQLETLDKLFVRPRRSKKQDDLGDLLRDS